MHYGCNDTFVTEPDAAFMSDTLSPIVETTTATFEQDVIERSRAVLVLVDFWAEWCGPCRILGPTLEKLAREYGGQFVLVKADTERLPGIANAFGIRSIPAVFAFKDGRVVDSFVGALPEAALRVWIDRLLPTPTERLVAEAKALEAKDSRRAEAKYREALALAPDDPAATAGLARVVLAQGGVEEAQALLERLEQRGYLEPEAEKLKAELLLRSQARQAGGVAKARAAVAAQPKDLTLRLKLAEALAAEGQHREALEILLELVERDRKGVGEEARKAMLAIFQVLPDDSELADEYRRRLSFVL
jgi:putative thioredoxin